MTLFLIMNLHSLLRPDGLRRPRVSPFRTGVTGGAAYPPGRRALTR
jgi:hypothetical protein